MVGMQFGRWMVLDIVKKYKNQKTYCKCQCSCEKRTIKMVYKNSLLTGESQSCGCLRKELQRERVRSNHIGERFGNLIVREMLYQYRGEHTYCLCDCDCGEEHICSLSNLITGHTTSCGCISSQLTWAERKTNLIGKRFGNLVVAEMLYGYKNTQTYCRCKCDCGNESVVYIGNLQAGKSMSCGCMENQSIGERIIKDILINNNVHFIPQKRFDGCRNINPLPFDFYLPDYNVCIEYDGIQHFEPVEFFGGQDGFKRRTYNDAIKTQYCINNNINLIRLPYMLSNDDIKQKILNIWNP